MTRDQQVRNRVQLEQVLHYLRALQATTQAGGSRSLSFVNIMEALSDFVSKDLDYMIDRLEEVKQMFED